jgi:hypothetical protein
VKAHESSVGTLVGILHKFGLVYDLEMNWHKKCGMLVRPMNPTKLSGEILVDVGCKWRFVKILALVHLLVCIYNCKLMINFW